MMSQKQTTQVINAHERSYDDPIRLTAGERVRITKQDMWDNDSLWLWCIADSGKEGWVPANFIERNGENGVVQYDYNAIELTVVVGENLTIFNEESGWYWVANQQGEEGWVPIICCQELD